MLVVDLTAGGDDGAETPATKPAPPGTDGTIAELDIADFAFEPTPAKVAAGATLEIANKDGAQHTVTSGTRDDAGKDFDVELDATGPPRSSSTSLGPTTTSAGSTPA